MEHIHLAAIQSASRIAAQAHAGMTRKDGTTPYIVHPARVAALVGHCGGNHMAIISAWLHDIFEVSIIEYPLCRGSVSFGNVLGNLPNIRKSGI